MIHSTDKPATGVSRQVAADCLARVASENSNFARQHQRDIDAKRSMYPSKPAGAKGLSLYQDNIPPSLNCLADCQQDYTTCLNQAQNFYDDCIAGGGGFAGCLFGWGFAHDACGLGRLSCVAACAVEAGADIFIGVSVDGTGLPSSGGSDGN